MFEIIFSQRAERQLKKMQAAVQKRIISALRRIRIRPEAFLTKQVGDSSYKLRVGDYRVLMDLDRGRLEILVIKVGHRKNIYKK